ncbi:MAG TPA: YCF48-related protein [Candidatus Bathyarchaeia archaeon]|nr:YCF48-related protein [Candidatus Bathyarchaeia archaeon]
MRQSKKSTLVLRATFGALAVLAVSLVAIPPVRAARIVENLYGCKLLDGQNGWAVGAFGVVYHTANGGKTWESQPTATTDYLFAVDFSSPQNGVVVGKSGTLLTTADGGKTWTKRNAGVDRNLFSVQYASPQHVWAVGDWGAVIESTDGGNTWKDRTLTEDIVLTSQSWPDEQHGYLAGEFGTVEVTSDGGATFNKIETGTDKTIFGVAFTSPDKGWAVGIDGLILRTKDAGKTWEVQRGTRETESLEQLGFMEAMRNPGLYDIRFSDTRGYIVGDTGMVLISDDRGETWKEHKLPAEMSLFWLRGVGAAPGDRALLVGANGLTVVADKDEMKLSVGG